eukprot:1998218-Rhodomonas_salina.1
MRLLVFDFGALVTACNATSTLSSDRLLGTDTSSPLPAAKVWDLNSGSLLPRSFYTSLSLPLCTNPERNQPKPKQRKHSFCPQIVHRSSPQACPSRSVEIRSKSSSKPVQPDQWRI